MRLDLLKKRYHEVLDARYGSDEVAAIFLRAIDHIDKCSQHHVITGESTAYTSEHHKVLDQLDAGRPIQYILGKAPFLNFELEVNEHVLIPRPETEELVVWIAERLGDRKVRILDIGTGSGCIAIGLKKALPSAEIEACDISTYAIATARSNANRLKAEIKWLELDILSDRIGHYDVLVSNPPYIDRSEADSMEEHVTQYEPHQALFVDDDDVLLFYKRIVHLAMDGGMEVYFETSSEYTSALDQWLKEQQLQFEWKRDLQGKLRMLHITPH